MGFFGKVGTFIMNLVTRRGVKNKLQQRFPELFREGTMFEFIDMWKTIYMGKPHLRVSQAYRFTMASGRQLVDLKQLNMAKIACEELRTLTFSEGLELNIDDDDTNEYFEKLFEDTNFWDRLANITESSFYALGGMVCMPYPKKTADGSVQLGYMFTEADLIFELSWEDDVITELVLVKLVTKRRKRYMHLQIHKMEGNTSIIENELYTAHSQTGDYTVPANITELYPDMLPEVKVNNVDRILPVYTKPAISNNIMLDSPLGVSVFANSIDTMLQINMVYDVWYSEFKNGRKRITVPAWALKEVIDPATQQPMKYFDPYDDTYQAFNMSTDESKIEDHTTEIRSEDIVGSIQAFLNIYAMEIGLTPGAFTFHGDTGAITATEVISKNSRTFKTKKKHERHLESFLRQIIENSFVVIKAFNIPTDTTLKEDIDIKIIFDDSIIVDDAAEREEARAEVQQDILSKRSYLRTYRGMNDEEIDEIFGEIDDERSVLSFDMGGSDPTGGNPIPGPQEGESKEDFVQRFMSDEKTQEEYPDEDQRLAVANQQWESSGS